MPMTLNVGLSRKVGEANFGSKGATVTFAVEVEASLVRQPDELREKVRYLFQLAKDAVDEELGGGGTQQDANGHGTSGNGSHRPSNGRSATDAQLRAIHAIANRNRIDLPARLTADFGISQPEDLSITDASTLIDSLKANGTGARR